VFSAHLPALQVVLPLLSAPICVLFRKSQIAWIIALAMSWLSLAIAVSLLGRVMDGGPIVYLMGDWAAPWGIEYKIDLLSAFVLLIVTGVGWTLLFGFIPPSPRFHFALGPLISILAGAFIVYVWDRARVARRPLGVQRLGPR